MRLGAGLPVRTLFVLAALWSVSVGPAGAIQRETVREIRARFEGLSLRLRVDLRPANIAGAPNVVSLKGVGYGRERSPVLFSRLEKVYLDRVTSMGARRLGLTVYRNAEEARQLRALAVPQPTMINPHGAGTLAAFAQLGSTSVLLELKKGKKDRPGQLQEIESLLDRVFYVDSEPARDELVAFIVEHRDARRSWLRALTGLEIEEIRAILERTTPP